MNGYQGSTTIIRQITHQYKPDSMSLMFSEEKARSFTSTCLFSILILFKGCYKNRFLKTPKPFIPDHQYIVHLSAKFWSHLCPVLLIIFSRFTLTISKYRISHGGAQPYKVLILSRWGLQSLRHFTCYSNPQYATESTLKMGQSYCTGNSPKPDQ